MVSTISSAISVLFFDFAKLIAVVVMYLTRDVRLWPEFRRLEVRGRAVGFEGVDLAKFLLLGEQDTRPLDGIAAGRSWCDMVASIAEGRLS